MTQTGQVLTKILFDIKTHRDAGGQAHAVFDLDSTLFDVRPRIIKIIQEFCIDRGMSAKYSNAVSILKNIQELNHSYYIKDHMFELGLQNEPPEFFKDIYNYWRIRFFHDDYVIHDEPVEGAVEFVQMLHQMNVKIIYLTGRDIIRMGKGTVDSLKKWKFPIETPLSELVLKPESSMDDAPFKRDHFTSLHAETRIWFFENEPMNLNLILKDCPRVHCVFFDSVHMGKGKEPRHLPTIKDFKLS